MSDGSLRSFVAIELAPNVREAAVAVSDSIRERFSGAEAGSLRWVRTEALHVTLRFLGNIEASRTGELAQTIATTVREVSPFTLSLGPLIGLPGDRRPRVIALDVHPNERLVELAGAVDRGVREAGLPGEKRRFRAHLTLARVREGRIRLPDARVARASMTVDEIVLFRSELTSRGPLYTPLERLTLGSSDHPRSRTISANQTTKEPQ